MAELQLDIVTPARRVVSETVDSVTVPTLNGEVGILPTHAPMISQLKSGILSYTTGGTTKKMVIAGGFLEVGAKNVSVLADSAEFPEELSAESVRAERAALEKSLGSWNGTPEEFEIEKDKLDRAEARLQLLGGR